MSEAALRTLALQVRNWGKWGPNDEIGTLNYITREKIAAAAKLVTAGTGCALGRDSPQPSCSAASLDVTDALSAVRLASMRRACSDGDPGSTV